MKQILKTYFMTFIEYLHSPTTSNSKYWGNRNVSTGQPKYPKIDIWTNLIMVSYKTTYMSYTSALNIICISNMKNMEWYWQQSLCQIFLDKQDYRYSLNFSYNKIVSLLNYNFLFGLIFCPQVHLSMIYS